MTELTKDYIEIIETKYRYAYGIDNPHGFLQGIAPSESRNNITANLLNVLIFFVVPGIVVARSIIVNARRLNPDLHVVARTSDAELLPVFKDLSVQEVVLPGLAQRVEEHGTQPGHNADDDGEDHVPANRV